MQKSSWTKALLNWYDDHRRELPWREASDPYAIWVSEVMLQQTQVQTVIPYYERFMAEVPGIPQLAALDDQRLRKLWEGLGYYRRASYLKKAAQVLIRDYGGRLPADYEALLGLPGIGPYTAAAIAAMAFQQPYVAMDGNLERIFARILGETEPIHLGPVKGRLKACAEAYLDHDRPGDYNQALMDLGAGVCLSHGRPLCPQCPWQDLCQGKAKGLLYLIPQKAPRKKRRQEARTIFVHVWGKQMLLRQRPDQGLLAGMWEFPNLARTHPRPLEAWEAAFGDRLGDLGSHQHIFSHIQWEMQGYVIQHETRPPFYQGQWVDLHEIASSYALPAAFQIYYQRALSLLSL